MINEFEKRNLKYIIVYNKAEVLHNIPEDDESKIYVSAKEKYNIEKLKNMISQELRAKVSNFLKKIIADKTDVFGVYATLNNQQGKRFRDWYESLENPADYLNHIEFRMTVNPLLTS